MGQSGAKIGPLWARINQLWAQTDQLVALWVNLGTIGPTWAEICIMLETHGVQFQPQVVLFQPQFAKFLHYVGPFETPS